jgi:hypothetical protein
MLEKIWFGFHRWTYYHAHWYFKMVSGYCYEMNCQIEETCKEIKELIKNLEEQQKINEIIRTRAYFSGEEVCQRKGVSKAVS